MQKTLLNDLLILSKNFVKILEVNLEDGSFMYVKGNEVCRADFTLEEWMKAFLSIGGVHPEDIDRFKEFFDADSIKKNLRKKWMHRIFYRRRFKNGWRMVCMEVVPMDNYSEEDPIILLTVRYVEDYIRDFHNQIGFGDYEDWR